MDNSFGVGFFFIFKKLKIFCGFVRDLVKNVILKIYIFSECVISKFEIYLVERYLCVINFLGD